MEFLFKASYLIFWLPAVAAMTFILIMGLTGFGFEGAEVDHDHDFGHDHDGHADHIDHDHNFVVKALSVLGMGRVPMSIVLVTFSMIWGFVGFAANKIFDSIGLPESLYIWFSIIGAFVLAIAFTRMISNTVSRIMPKTESYADNAEAFVGRRGVVQFTVTAQSGAVRVQDQGGNQVNIQARIVSGDDSISPNKEVIVVDYLSNSGEYIVALHALSFMTTQNNK